MIALAWILLLAASPSVELFDDVIRIKALEWREADIDLRQRPGLLSVRFDTASDPQQVKIALIRREDLALLWKRQPHDVLAELAPASSGQLDFRVPSAGEYSVIVRNLSEDPARVHLRIRVHYPRVTTLSPERRLTVVAISVAFFLGVVTFSTRKLLRGIRG